MYIVTHQSFTELFSIFHRSAKVSRKPPRNPQQPRLNRTQLPQAFLTNKREDRELERKLKALKTKEDEKLKVVTRQHKSEKSSTTQTQQMKDSQTISYHRMRPRHGDNKWKRNLALARYPTPPEISLFHNSRTEVSHSSCDFQLSGSSDSSQEENSITNATNAVLHPCSTDSSRATTPHPHFANSSTNCSPIYRRRTIPTILVTDMDRCRLSPLLLRNMERVQVLSNSMPALFRNDQHKTAENECVNEHPSSNVTRSRPRSARSSVVKLPPISPHPHPLTASHNSAKEKDLHVTGLRTTLLM